MILDSIDLNPWLNDEYCSSHIYEINFTDGDTYVLLASEMKRHSDTIEFKDIKGQIIATINLNSVKSIIVKAFCRKD